MCSQQSAFLDFIVNVQIPLSAGNFVLCYDFNYANYIRILWFIVQAKF